MATTKMTGRERFHCALNHKEADYVPVYEVFYSQKFFKDILGWAPDNLDPVAVAQLAIKAGYDASTFSGGGASGYNPGGTKDVYTDEWGVTYKKDPTSWPGDGPISYPLKTAEDWKNYTMPDPTLESRYTPVKDAVKLAHEHGIALYANVRGPFSGSWMMFGMDNFAPLLYRHPDVVDDVLTKMTDFSIYGAVKMLDLGIDAIQFADDYGSNLQPLISPKHFAKHIAPQIKRLADAVHKAGGKLSMHSDGAIMKVLPMAVEQGIDGLNPIQRGAGMDLKTVKDLYGDKVCIFGNVDQRDLMVNGTAAEVEEQAKECIKIAAPGGGYCLGSDHSIHDDIPTENVLAILEAGRKYGKYPIQL